MLAVNAALLFVLMEHVVVQNPVVHVRWKTRICVVLKFVIPDQEDAYVLESGVNVITLHIVKMVIVLTKDVVQEPEPTAIQDMVPVVAAAFVSLITNASNN